MNPETMKLAGFLILFMIGWAPLYCQEEEEEEAIYCQDAEEEEEDPISFFKGIEAFTPGPPTEFCQAEHASGPPEQTAEDMQILTITTTINNALFANRAILGTYEAHERAEINLEINESFFDLKMTPTTMLGLSGGGEFGTGAAYGGGYEFAKKFENGTWVSIEPTIYKRGKKTESNVRTTISQPLLRGFGREYNMNSVRAAQYLLRTSYRGVYQNQISLILKSISSLYAVAKQREALKLYQASYDRLKGYRDAAKIKEKIGLSDPEDVYRAETAFKQAEDALNTAKEQFDEAQDALRDLLAWPLDTKISVAVPFDYQIVKLNTEEAIQTALKNRIEIDQVYDSFRESIRLSKISKDNLWPELNIVFTYSDSGIVRYLFDTDRYKRDNTWNIGFTTSTDINKQADQLAYDQALVAVSASRRTIDQIEANIAMEVKRVLRVLERSVKRIELQETQIDNALGELKLAQLKFDRGFADNFNVIQAERNLISARTSLLSAIVEHILGQYQLLQTLGLLADKPCIN